MPCVVPTANMVFSFGQLLKLTKHRLMAASLLSNSSTLQQKAPTCFYALAWECICYGLTPIRRRWKDSHHGRMML